ncbi:YIP1 family protein [Thermoactinomyces mirandus]|uniref:YIP1 family protein n=1 Tax=Thermoactinomyces mirandus TaxID=2756294 RepID=A0A7W1XPR7_9BACL|nr:YIP1 family protein [Thermoactinomyces mirandus]MBA4600974.1 YIP1 family protein [Thermoactinomyces mirandus]
MILKEYWVPLIKQPKSAIRLAIDKTSGSILFVLIALFGITLFLEQAMNQDTGDSMSVLTILILFIIIGPIIGAISWFLSSLCTYGTTRLFKGTATFKETYKATAWATIPYTTKLALFIPMLLIFREENFTTETPDIDSSFFLLLLFFIALTISLIMSIYYFVAYSKIIGEINKIGSWKGFVSIILVPVIFILLLLVLALILN